MYILPRTSDDIDHPSITIGIKIEREMEYMTFFDSWSLSDFLYTLRYRIKTCWAISRVEPHYKDGDYSKVNYYIELRGGGYGAHIHEMENDPKVGLYTPGYQECYYDDYNGYSMEYKGERFSIPKPYNLTEEDQNHWEESTPSQQFDRNIKFLFVDDIGYENMAPFTLEKMSIIPKAKQLSILRAKFNRLRGYSRKKKQLHILSIYNDDNGTVIVRVSNERSSKWDEEGANTPGFQKCSWDFFEPNYVEYNFFHGEWYSHEYPLPEEAIEAIKEENPQSDSELLTTICKYL